MSACSCFLPVWSSCSGLSCGREGKPTRTMAMLTQSHDMVNYGTNSGSAPLTFQLHGENKVTLIKPLVVRWSVASKQNLTLYGQRRPFSSYCLACFEASEITLQRLPPLMASAMIFIKHFIYLCFIYIVSFNTSPLRQILLCPFYG